MTTQIKRLELSRRSMLRGTVTIAGAAIVLPAMGGLAGCKSTPPTLAEHQALLSAVIDRIIPETKTGGAIAAGVPEYVAAVFEQHFTPDQQRDFAGALPVFDDLAKNEVGGDFASASTEVQDKVLTALDTAGNNAAGKAVWQQLRDIAVFGYYTSEVATQELAYEELPGRYDGCVPLADVGGAWLERGV